MKAQFTAALLASCAALGLAAAEPQPETVTVGPYDIAGETLVTLAFLSFLDGEQPSQEAAAEWNGFEDADRTVHIDAVLAELQADPDWLAANLPAEAILSDRSKPAEDQTKAEPKPAKPAAARDRGAGKGGKSARKSEPEAPALVHVVMRTSRYLGTDGRSIARNRVAETTADRAAKLVKAGDAVLATPAAIAAAAGAIAELA